MPAVLVSGIPQPITSHNNNNHQQQHTGGSSVTPTGNFTYKNYHISQNTILISLL